MLTRAALSLTVLGTLLLGACTDNTRRGFAGDASSSADATDVHTSTTPDATWFPQDGPIIPTDPDGGDLNPDAACATMRSPAAREPLNLLILLDRSGSMSECASGSTGSGTSCSSGLSKWDAVRAAVRRMVMALDDASLVGLTVFPASSNPSSVDGYTTPTIPIQPLSVNRATLLSYLDGGSPNGGTPMACAVPGSLSVLNAPDMYRGPRSVLLVTDGEPSDECSGVTCNPFDIAAFITCEMGATRAAQVAILASVSGGLRAGVRTYAIGMGAADSNFLSTVALNGGTARSMDCLPESCHYSVSSASFDSDIDMALDEIRGRAASCEYQITIDPATADLNQVNVNFYPGDSMPPRIIPHDSSRTNGWSFSDDSRSIILYGQPCDDVRSNSRSGSQVEILYGCPTLG